jgi:phosphoribosylanthranilate isomerase
MTKIKICGIKTEEQAIVAAEAGADFIGLVFAPSRRQVTEAQAEKIVTALKKHGAKTEIIGVFVNAHAGTINRIAEKCRLDRVQLSGDEPWEYCRDIKKPIIKVMRVSRNKRSGQVSKDLKYGTKLLKERDIIFLLDSNAREKYGGTGMTFDWKLAVPIAGKFPVIIAGGLNPDNVATAIKLISPWGVDVSTGVETRGVKDIEKIKRFIEAVKKADEGQEKR